MSQEETKEWEIFEAEVMVSYFSKEVESLSPNEFGKYPRTKDWLDRAVMSLNMWKCKLTCAYMAKSRKIPLAAPSVQTLKEFYAGKNTPPYL